METKKAPSNIPWKELLYFLTVKHRNHHRYSFPRQAGLSNHLHAQWRACCLWNSFIIIAWDVGFVK
jgi:hypothetical protein